MVFEHLREDAEFSGADDVERSAQMLRDRFRRESLQDAGRFSADDRRAVQAGASSGFLTYFPSPWRAVKTHDETVPLASDDVNHELVFQPARVDRDERLDDPAIRVRNDEVREALAGPLDRGESRDEELAPPLCREEIYGQA